MLWIQNSSIDIIYVLTARADVLNAGFPKKKLIVLLSQTKKIKSLLLGRFHLLGVFP